MINMKNAILNIMIAALLTSSGCGETEKADLAIVNANVFTVDAQTPYAEAIAVKNGIILAVGSNKNIEKYIDSTLTRVIDADGRSVIPGFNDAHAHFGPVDPDYIELRYVTDPAVITNKVKEQVAEERKGAAHFRWPLGA